MHNVALHVKVYEMEDIEGGGDLAVMLIRDGLAWWYEQDAPGATEYSRLERQARNAGRGLRFQANPTSPWEWRDSASGPGETSTEDKDCSDFSTYSEALQSFGRTSRVIRTTSTVTAMDSRAKACAVGRDGLGEAYFFW